MPGVVGDGHDLAGHTLSSGSGTPADGATRSPAAAELWLAFMRGASTLLTTVYLSCSSIAAT